MSDHDALSLAIRTAREARGLSHADVANAIGDAYRDLRDERAALCSWVAAVEAGEDSPDAEAVEQLATGIGVSAQERDHWLALVAVGSMPEDLVQLLQAKPGLWDAVHRLLAGGV